MEPVPAVKANLKGKIDDTKDHPTDGKLPKEYAAKRKCNGLI